MFGKATIDIPGCGHIGPSYTEGLSDEMAMTIGRTAAMTLSELDGLVMVKLSDGEVKVIGCDTTTGEITIGRLTRPWRGGYRAKKEREGYGTTG